MSTRYCKTLSEQLHTLVDHIIANLERLIKLLSLSLLLTISRRRILATYKIHTLELAHDIIFRCIGASRPKPCEVGSS